MTSQHLETPAVSAAKNIVRDALETELQEQGIPCDPFESELAADLISLADTTVEALLSAGVEIPDNLQDPHAVR